MNKNNVFLKIVVGVLLFILSLGLSLVYFLNSDINPNIRSHDESSLDIIQKNNVISGKFKSSDNYLGIISVRLRNESINSEDSVFKIKNILDDNWHHIATISATQYYTQPFYSFGFPVIEKSKDKVYQFEIKLLSGNRGLSLSKQEPVLVSSYAYPKEIFLKNPRLLLRFIRNKVSYYLHSQDSWKVYFVYNLPLLLYLLYILALHRFISDKNKNRFKKIFKNFANPTIITILVAMAIDIFVIRKYTNSTTSWLTLLWILGVISYRLEAKYSFGLALIFLTFCPFLLSANMNWAAEKSAIWTYMMLAIGTFQSLFEISPFLQKMKKIYLVKTSIKPLRFIFLSFDHLIINFFIKRKMN
jgi:hypothetical protein